MYEDIMQRRRGLGDVVIAHPEGIVVNSDFFPGVVVSQGAEGYDQQQDTFADDMLTSGDEGIGFMQARRLKQKLKRNRRRITETGYAVAAATPYQFGAISFNFKRAVSGAAKGGIIGSAAGAVIGGLRPKISFKKSPRVFGGPLVSTVDALRARYEQGDQAAVLAEIDRNRKTAKDRKAWERIYNEIVPTWSTSMVMPTVAPTVPVVAVATPSPVGTPAPAPTPAATDTTGQPIPTAIQAASAALPQVIYSAAAPTASEEVATVTQDDQTQQAMQAGIAGPFTMPDFKDPKVLLALGGVAFLIFTQMGRKGSRRRSRRR